MSYSSLGETVWGDPCSKDADCDQPDYLCKNGECYPNCSANSTLNEDEDGWICECNDGYEDICVPYGNGNVSFLKRKINLSSALMLTTAGALISGAIVYAWVRR